MNEEYIDPSAAEFDDAPNFSGRRTDGEIIALFFERDETALSAVNSKYGRYISAVAMNVLGDIQDAEECVNDTYHATWNSLPPEKPNCFFAYLARQGNIL